MNKLVLGAVTIAACAVLAPSAAAGPATTYFIGHGDAHHAKVSFRVKGGSAKFGLLETKLRVKTASGYFGPITAFDGFKRTPIGSKERFKSRRERGGGGYFSRFVFAGHLLDGSSAEGRAKAKYKTKNFISDSGKIRWEAEAVSWKRYQGFSGFGNSVLQLRGPPGPLLHP